MHRVVDELVEQLKKTGTTKSREDVWKDTIEAVRISGYLNTIFKGPVPDRFRKGDRPEHSELLTTVFLVAIIARYTAVEEALLASGEVAPDCVDAHFGCPCYQAVRLGYRDTISRLIKAGAFDKLAGEPSFIFGYDPLKLDSRIYRGLAEAGSNGYYEVLEPLLGLSQVDSYRFHLCRVTIRSATEHYQWEAVFALLNSHWDDILAQDLQYALYWATKSGANDKILQVLEYGCLPRSERTQGCKRYPLQEAVYQGNLSTVELLVDNLALGYRIDHATIAQSVVLGGNFELFKLLKEKYFHKLRAEWYFLPLAAELGHLDFVRYALQHPKLPRKGFPSMADRQTMLNDMRAFSMYQAISWGHLDVVRALGTALGRELQDRSMAPSMSYLATAIDTGNVDMVRLLTKDLGMELLSPLCTLDDFNFEHRELRFRYLQCWKLELGLGRFIKAYKYNYFDVRKRDIEAAFLAAGDQE